MAKRGRPPKGFVPVDAETPELLELWNRALASPHGIAIASQKPNLLATRLYRVRRECGHNAYAHLRVIELEEEVRICPR